MQMALHFIQNILFCISIALVLMKPLFKLQGTTRYKYMKLYFSANNLMAIDSKWLVVCCSIEIPDYVVASCRIVVVSTNETPFDSDIKFVFPKCNLIIKRHRSVHWKLNEFALNFTCASSKWTQKLKSINFSFGHWSKILKCGNWKRKYSLLDPISIQWRNTKSLFTTKPWKSNRIKIEISNDEKFPYQITYRSARTRDAHVRRY